MLVSEVVEVPLVGRLPGSTDSGNARSRSASFSAFVAGAENSLAASAVDSLLSDDASSYNPLVLCGPPGVGKTHLAAGLASVWKARHGGPVMFTTGAEFAREFAHALETDSLGAWRKSQRGARLWVIDDLTQLAAKRSAQQELLFTLDALAQHGGQVVATTRLAPAEIAAFPPALCARLTGGLLVSLFAPGREARRLLVRRLAAAREMELAGGAADLLADSLAVSVPELHAALCELQMSELSTGDEPLETAVVRRFLAARAARSSPSLRGITRLTAKYFGLKMADLVSPSRRRAVVLARGIAVYLGRQLTDNSLEQLGVHFGGRDHTTVLHSYRSTDERLRHDPEIRRAIADLRKMLALS